MPERAVSDLTVTYNVALVTVDYLPNDIKLISDIFNKIAEQKINIDLINQAPPYRGTVNISFSIPADDVAVVIGTLNSFKKQVPDLRVEVDAGNTKLSVYGQGMKNLPGVAARLFTILANNGIEIKLITTSEVDISYLIYEKDVDKAIESIKREFNMK